MEIHELEEVTECRAAVPILRQLWSDADPEEVLDWTGEESYHLFGRFDDDEIVAVAGVLVAEMLHHTRHGGVAGVVVLDALADSTHDPDNLGFLRYEFEPDGNLNEEQEAELERERETVRRLAEGDYDDDETIWGRPGTWHRSVRNYNPAGTASSLDVPVFVLKTGRADKETQPELVAWFQDEFEKWRTVDLADGSRVEFYEGLDHYFQEGFAPTDPLMSLYFGGNVPDYVIADLVKWIHDATPASRMSG